MQRLFSVVVALLVGVMLYAGYLSMNVREQLNRVNRALEFAHKTETDLQRCLKSLGQHKITSIRVNSERTTLAWRIRYQKKDIVALNEKTEKLPEMDKEIELLRSKLKTSTNEESLLKEQVKEAETALKNLKERAKKANQPPPQPPNPPKQG